MKSFQTALESFGAGLARVCKAYHYWRPKLDPPFCVWAEDGEDDSFSSDNRKQEQQIHGTVDYFTKKEYDPTVDAIQSYLNSLDDFGWRLNSVQYEDETNLIHFEWEFWIG